MNKPYLAFMAGPGSLEDLKELVEPVKQYFRGICALVHDSDENDPEVNYLWKVNHELNGGNIITGKFVGRHDHSRNRILYETGIQEGDYLVTLDTLERIPVEFAENLQHLISQMEQSHTYVLYYYSKPYVIKFREDMQYVGNPHESLRSSYRAINSFELSNNIKDESKVRVNMRPIKRRDPKHFINHYLKYFLYPNSNQNLLGLEHKEGEANKNFQDLENIRLGFRELLRKRGVNNDLESVQKLFSGPMDDELKYYINNHKHLNDFYLYNILKDESVVDDHTWKTMKKI